MKHLLLSILIGVLFIIPAVSFALPIVPCDGAIGVVCQGCHLVELGQRIINFLIEIIVVGGAIVFAIGGMRMVMSAGNSGEVSSAKSMMTNVVIGLVILLAGWLIIDTVLKLFVNEDVTAGMGPWNEIQCVAQPTLTEAQPVTPVTPVTPGVGQLTDANARKLLSDAGISVNKTEAQGTSLQGINEATIQNAINLKNACGCSVTITAGTESTGGHAGGAFSHSTGYKYDIRLDPALTNYIQTNYTQMSARSDGAMQYKDSAGNIYAKEGDHWDVLVKGG